MNPQANIAYCIKHCGFVNGLREKRGGWQEWDWGWDTVVGELIPPSIGDRVRLLGDVWLPTSDDVLGMLTIRGIRPTLTQTYKGWSAWAFPPDHYCHADDAETPLIALLELLRAVEGKG